MKRRKGVITQEIDRQGQCVVPANPLVNVHPNRLKKLSPRFAR